MVARGVMEPIPEHIDEDRFAIQAAKVLGISALEIPFIPLHFLGTVKVQLEAERIEHERDMKKAAARRKQGR